ncbi:PGSC2-like protein, partial [Mya arenaria]
MVAFRNIILAVFFAQTTVQGVSADCCDALNIITRAEWGARDPKSTENMSVPVSTFFIHHTDTNGCETQDVCSACVRSIQRFHMDTNKWDDIGYSFLIGGDGNVYEGRGWNFVGAHTKGLNLITRFWAIEMRTNRIQNAQVMHCTGKFKHGQTIQ